MGESVVFGATVGSIDPAATVIEGVPTYKTTLYFEKSDARSVHGPAFWFARESRLPADPASVCPGDRDPARPERESLYADRLYRAGPSPEGPG